MNARELRKKYIEFFISKNGKEHPSASLVPIDALGNEDPSLLFTSAGMVQFKPFFRGVAKPPHSRLTTAQKCLRTTDIESVGDGSHLTFFEMMGNFSFGDYFKKEAIIWAWEFLLDKLELNPDRLRVTVYKDDDEAADLWHKEVALPYERIARFDEDSNYWPGSAISKGPNGPCGPCSEIFYDMMPEMPYDPDWDGEGERWLEIWNLVFMQYERSGDFIIENPATKEGRWENVKLTPLPAKNIDTGMGLERTSTALSGFANCYDTDVLYPIINRIEELSGKKYKDFQTEFRIIADHIRSAAFCVADGVRPENTGRGYVLRRLIRRAILKGQRKLGFNKPFFSDVYPAVADALSDQYTELNERKSLIIRTLTDEEMLFRETLREGIKRAENMALTGRDAFTLYDTYGFPLEVTMELASERGHVINLEEFNSAMEEQRKRSKAAGGMAFELFSADTEAAQDFIKTAPATIFTGYENDKDTAVVLGIIQNGKSVEAASSDSPVEIILNCSPFYAESGGQTGDSGTLKSDSVEVIIHQTLKSNDRWIHLGKIVSGTLRVNDTVCAQVDIERRNNIRANHTATHLLHAALRTIVGDHVHQAGSLVAPDYLRFDFTHNKALTENELSSVEAMVNKSILQDILVHVHDGISIADAKAKGAMALFGEKYGDTVRMIEVDDFSRELCGGLHVSRTSQIGLFKIISEGSVAGGVRRIEAITGLGVYEYLLERDKIIKELSRLLKTAPTELANSVEKLQSSIKQIEKKLEETRAGKAASNVSADINTVKGITVVSQQLTDADQKTTAAVADMLAAKHEQALVVVGGSGDGKVFFVVKASPTAVERGLHAGNLVRELAMIAGGGGGGRADFAQAGGKDPSKLEEALSTVASFVEKHAKN